MRFRTSENPCCGNHPCCANDNGSSAQTHFANMRAAITMRFAGNENRCYANRKGSSAHNRGGAQRRLRAPQPLLEARGKCFRHLPCHALAAVAAHDPGSRLCAGLSLARSPILKPVRAHASSHRPGETYTLPVKSRSHLSLLSRQAGSAVRQFRLHTLLLVSRPGCEPQLLARDWRVAVEL